LCHRRRRGRRRRRRRRGGGRRRRSNNNNNLGLIQTERNIKIFNMLMFVIAQKVIIVKQKICWTVVRRLEMQ
jgi:hypothetical protein